MVGIRPRSWVVCAALLAAACAGPGPDDDDATAGPGDDDDDAGLPSGDPATLTAGAEVVCGQPSDAVHLPFEDATDAAGIGFDPGTYAWPPEDDSYNTLDVEMRGGFVVGDLDGDGDADLLFTDGDRPPRLFLADADGDGDPADAGAGAGAVNAELRFVAGDAAARGIDAGEGAFLTGASAADVDADGDLDLLLLTREEDVYLENDGSGVFTDATAGSGFGGRLARSVTASWADVDRDGDLDAFVAAHGQGAGVLFDQYPPDRDALLIQGADGTFADTIDDVVPLEDEGHAFLGGWFDADRDGWPDLYVVNDLADGENGKPGNRFHRNDGAGGLEAAPEAGLDVLMLGMGLALGDLDGDGDDDVHVSNIGRTFLARNDTDLPGATGPLFTDLSLTVEDLTARPTGDVSWSTFTFDHDNDGALELFTAYGQLISRYDPVDGGPEGSTNAPEQQDTLLRWDDELGAWVDDAPWVGINDPAITRTAAAVDLDGDGFAELITWALRQGTRLWRSGCTDAAWLAVALEDGTSRNRDAVGAVVEAWADGERLLTRPVRLGSTGGFGSTPPEVHLGVGALDEVAVVVTWPDGEVTVNAGIPTRRRITLSR